MAREKRYKTIPDEYKVETIYDYYTPSTTFDYLWDYLGRWLMFECTYQFKDEGYGEGDKPTGTRTLQKLHHKTKK